MTSSPGLRHFPESDFLDHPSHARIGITPFPARLNVVTMLENPVRSRNRYHNYWQFERMVESSGAVLWTVEVAFGDRPHELTDAHNPHHIQLRTRDELWHKENALNIAFQHVAYVNPGPDEVYVAWIDADVSFARTDWAQETLQLLQHYDVIQMFSYAQDLDHNEAPMDWNLHQGFMYLYSQQIADPLKFGSTGDADAWDAYYPGWGTKPAGAYMHPGYAWAARLSSLEKVGMLLDWAILGSGDWHMAWGWIGQMDTHIVPELSRNYRLWCSQWQAAAEQHIKRNVGYMPGLLLHHYHGSKNKRRYGDRWKYLIQAHYDPVVDLKKDRYGLWQLSGNNPTLRDAIRAYTRMRNEDELPG